MKMNLTLELLLSAFGGGCLASLIGGLPSFIFCGVIAIAGLAGGEAGAPLVGMAFGPWFGPHIAFAGGAAAAAIAGKKGLLESGADIGTPLYKFSDISVIVVGGIFGVVGCIVQLFYAETLGLARMGNGFFDTIALTVLTMGIIARFVFGKTGLTGKRDGKGLMPESKSLVFETFCGVVLGLISAYVSISTGLTALPFGLSAVSLILLHYGAPSLASHQMTNCAAVAAAAFIATGAGASPATAVIIGAIFGGLGGALGSIYGSIFNSHVDTHIDPPAMAIATLTLITALVF
jgi:hypothetical protein